MAILKDEDRAIIDRAKKRYEQFIEDKYEEMVWELSMKLGLDESIIKEFW